MSSRREHSKSRRGCAECKQRRIKCDEITPRCGPCTKKGLACEYRHLQAVQAHIHHILTQASFQQSSSSKKQPQPPPQPQPQPQPQFENYQYYNNNNNNNNNSDNASSSSSTSKSPSQSQSESNSNNSSNNVVLHADSFSADDMLLMHHFTLFTARTLGVLDHADYHFIWQTRVPQLACQHRYLMYAVLSIAAAHRRSYQLCRQLYLDAINSFVAAPPDAVSSAQAESVYCYAVLIMLITFTLECSDPPREIRNPVAGVAEFFGVICTAIGMLSVYRDELRQREVGRLLNHMKPPMLAHPLPPEIALSLDGLDTMLTSQISPFVSEEDNPSGLVSPDHALPIREAIAHMRRFYTIVHPQPSSWVYLLQWPMALSPEYLCLLRRNNTAAVAVFTHWCVPLHHAPTRWFMGDWPRRVVRAIAMSLAHTPWLETIAWPVAQVEMELEKTAA